MDFRLNLIKNEAMSAKKRRTVFFLMILYIIAISSLFVILSYKTTVNFTKVADYKREAGSFRGQKNLDIYAKEVTAKMLSYAGRLEAIDKILSDHTDLSRILLGLSNSLSGGAHIDNFNFDSSSNKIEFDIVVSGADTEEGPNTNELISTWKSDEYLASIIKEIESASTAKSESGDTSVTVLKFSCLLAGKGP
jgi:hypothetical protein